MSQPIIDVLGQKLISGYVEVLRKHSLSLLDGQRYQGADWYEAKYSALRSLNPAQHDAVAKLLDDLVVSSCHAFLDLLDKESYGEADHEGRIMLKIVDSKGIEVDAARSSDGLAGELYGESGWLERFARKQS